jgi:hypothetical protein
MHGNRRTPTTTKANGDDDDTTSLHIPEEGEHRSHAAIAASSDSEAKDLEYRGAYLCIYLCCSLPTGLVTMFRFTAHVWSRTTERWPQEQVQAPSSFVPSRIRSPSPLPSPARDPHWQASELSTFVGSDSNSCMEFVMHNHPLSSTLLEMKLLDKWLTWPVLDFKV